ALEMPVAAHVVEVQMRVDERRHIRDREAAELELPRNRLRLGLLRELEGQDAARVLEPEAGVEEEKTVVVLDEDRVGRDAHRVAGRVLEALGVPDDDRAGVQQPDPHAAGSCSRALRTATSLAARRARSSSICSAV